MSRDDLLLTNSKIMRSVAEAVKENAPDSIVIIILMILVKSRLTYHLCQTMKLMKPVYFVPKMGR